MWYVLITFFALLLVFLLMRLRLRIEISESRKLLFLGIGRTGPEFDFINRIRRFRLFGIPMKSGPLDPAARITPAAPTSEEPNRRPKHTPSRRIRVGEWLTLLPDLVAAGFSFVFGLCRSAVIEECNGTIRVGAASPDQTGHLFGCYCALAGAVPAIGTRLSFEPDWTDGPSLSGSVRFSAALPIYVLAYRLLVLIWSLPLWQIYKLSRMKPKGVPHGQ